MFVPPVRRTLLLAFAILLALPAAAWAGPSQESIFQDDGALIDASGAKRDRTLDQLKSLGVNVIRTNLVWAYVAPHPGSKRKPRFDETDPGRYNLGRWDGLVQEAAARGLDVLMTVTGPAPVWASRCGGPASLRRICNPNPVDFGNFVTAVGRRYDGTFLEVPRVSQWSIWNEPNQSAWLYPQLQLSRGQYRPYAPRLYRDLSYAAITALHQTGHGSDRILLGETAPLGRTFGPPAKRSLNPSAFLEGLFCMDSRGHTLRGADASALGCGGGFKRVLVTGYAHHPYTRGAGRDPRSPVGPGDITLSTLGRLGTELHRAAHLRRVSRLLPVFLTEYGIQTDPPDRSAGVPLSVQAGWLNLSDWIAFGNRSVLGVSQYELYDDFGTAAFQTGLRFRNGRAKPSLAAYRLPIWVSARGRTTTVWGQVRPGGVGSRVAVLFQTSAHSGFHRATTLSIGNPRGFFSYTSHRSAFRWQLQWLDADGHVAAVSRVAGVGS